VVSTRPIEASPRSCGRTGRAGQETERQAGCAVGDSGDARLRVGLVSSCWAARPVYRAVAATSALRWSPSATFATVPHGGRAGHADRAALAALVLLTATPRIRRCAARRSPCNPAVDVRPAVPRGHYRCALVVLINDRLICAWGVVAGAILGARRGPPARRGRRNPAARHLLRASWRGGETVRSLVSMRRYHGRHRRGRDGDLRNPATERILGIPPEGDGRARERTGAPDDLQHSRLLREVRKNPVRRYRGFACGMLTDPGAGRSSARACSTIEVRGIIATSVTSQARQLRRLRLRAHDPLTHPRIGSC
jgi:hypothetical protein